MVASRHGPSLYSTTRSRPRLQRASHPAEKQVHGGGLLQCHPSRDLQADEDGNSLGNERKAFSGTASWRKSRSVSRYTYDFPESEMLTSIFLFCNAGRMRTSCRSSKSRKVPSFLQCSLRCNTIRRTSVRPVALAFSSQN